MQIVEFEHKHNIKLIPKHKSLAMRIIGFFSKSFINNFWTTYRLPFQKQATIAYPESNDISKYDQIPDWAMRILEHELVHVKDMSSSWGLFKMFWLVWLLPLPILFSGRWFIERHAYLYGMIKYNDNVDERVDALWNGYAWPWPKYLMRKWFNKKLNEHKE